MAFMVNSKLSVRRYCYGNVEVSNYVTENYDLDRLIYSIFVFILLLVL